MSKDPWKYKTWSERQAAWFMAELPEIDFEAGKVEGETDDAFFGMEYPESAGSKYQATNDLKAIMRSKPSIIGAPILSNPTTTDGKRAYECLERLRTAVKWGRLQPVDGQALCWTGGMWKKIPIDEIPKDVCPIRFSVDKQELKHWMKAELQSNKKQSGGHKNQPDGFYIAALLLAWKIQDAPKSASSLIDDMDQGNFDAPGYETLQRAVRAAKAGEKIKYPDNLHSQSRKPAKSLLAYACEYHSKGDDFKKNPIPTIINLLRNKEISPLPTVNQCSWLEE
ncbi:hypothetical protein HHSLTHF2_11060 [Vreelandella venusta]|uniref:Uncharacterized protein n=1 Tax=Halomonas hydrothermalis TaxID=115561 RepID=A0A6F8U258_9GAMM|nr:hypothetical protein [Halomonas hydrothermalis]BCB07216.1 hypothetical protein HHSLTHF2_11060 [Halomonas hydrothermalis]